MMDSAESTKDLEPHHVQMPIGTVTRQKTYPLSVNWRKVICWSCLFNFPRLQKSHVSSSFCPDIPQLCITVGTLMYDRVHIRHKSSNRPRTRKTSW
jgi:hypothetical protein